MGGTPSECREMGGRERCTDGNGQTLGKNSFCCVGLGRRDDIPRDLQGTSLLIAVQTRVIAYRTDVPVGYFDEKPRGCPFVITVADGHVTDVTVLPCEDEDSSPCLLCLCVFLSTTQRAISPDRAHPRLEYTVAPLGLVAVYLSLHDRCCNGDRWAGSFHFHLCGNLRCVWHK
jgi:hypothetical protein